MKAVCLTIVATLALMVAADAASRLPPAGSSICGAPEGISRVAERPASCCADLPCHRPLSFGGIATGRHPGRT